MYSSLLSVIKKSSTALVANRKGFYADVGMSVCQYPISIS